MNFLQKNAPKRITSRLKPIHGAPDLLPFVNIFFLLLFFFMLGSSFVPVSGIPVNLPEVSETRIHSVKKYVVTLDRQDRIYFNDMMVENLQQLKGKLLSHVVGKGPDSGRKAIVLRADKNNSFARVAGIMALAEELQLNVFILATRNRGSKADFSKEDRE